MPAGAALEPGVIWVVAILFWVIGRVRDRAKASRPEVRRPPVSLEERARGVQTTQEEAVELERWLREKLGGGAPKPAPPPPVVVRRAPTPTSVARKNPIPAPRKTPAVQTGPLGRRAVTPLESHAEIEDRRSLERERVEVDYDDEFIARESVREAPAIIDLDNESAFAAQRRRMDAERRNRAHTAEDHDAFHDRITSPDLHAANLDAVRAKRRKALRASWITSEILGPPVSSRRTS